MRIALFFGFLILFSQLQPVVINAQPKLHVEQRTIDLGVIYNGDEKNLIIWIKNTGNDVLRILDMHVPCGCTTVKKPKAELHPNERDKLEVSFNSTGMRGRVSRNFTLITNSSSAEDGIITLTAEVRSVIETADRSSVFWLGNIPIQTGFKKTLNFVNTSQEEVFITKGISNNKDVSFSFKKFRASPASTFSIEVTVTPSTEGYQLAECFLITTHAKQQRVPIRIAYIGTK